MFSLSRKGPLCIVAASICWSLGGLLIKVIPWGAMSIIGLRALLAAAVFAVFNKGVKVELTKGNILGALSLSATTILFVWANKLTTAAAAILLQFSSPVFIILLLFIFHHRRPKPSELVAVFAAVAGMFLFFAEQLEAGSILGNLLAIGSGITFASVIVSNQRADAKPEQAIMLGFIINAVIGLPFAFFEVTTDPMAWGAILILGIVQVGLAYVFFSIGIKSTPALLACLITALEPILNPTWVAIATGEIPGSFTITGGVVIVTTVITYNVWVEKRDKWKL